MSWLEEVWRRIKEQLAALQAFFAMEGERDRTALGMPLWSALTKACHDGGLHATWLPSGDKFSVQLSMAGFSVEGSLKVVLGGHTELAENDFDRKFQQYRYTLGNDEFLVSFLSLRFDTMGQLPSRLRLLELREDTSKDLSYLLQESTQKSLRLMFGSHLHHFSCRDGAIRLSFGEFMATVPTTVATLRRSMDLVLLLARDLGAESLSARLPRLHQECREATPLLDDRELSPLALGIQATPDAPWVVEALEAWIASPPFDVAARAWMFRAIEASEGVPVEAKIMACARQDKVPSHRLIGLLYLGDAGLDELLTMCLDPTLDTYSRDEVLHALISRFPAQDLSPTFAEMVMSDHGDVRVAGICAQSALAMEQVATHYTKTVAEQIHFAYHTLQHQLKPLFAQSKPAGLQRLFREWSWLHETEKTGELVPLIDQALIAFLREETTLVQQGESGLVPILSSLQAFDGPALVPFLLEVVPFGGAVCREAARLLGKRGDQRALLSLRLALKEETNRANRRSIEGAISAIEVRVGVVAEGGMSLMIEEEDVAGGLSMEGMVGGEVSLEE